MAVRNCSAIPAPRVAASESAGVVSAFWPVVIPAHSDVRTSSAWEPGMVYLASTFGKRKRGMLIEEGKTSLLESQDEDDHGKLGRRNWNFDASINLMWVRGRVGKIDGEKSRSKEAEVFRKFYFLQHLKAFSSSRLRSGSIVRDKGKLYE